MIEDLAIVKEMQTNSTCLYSKEKVEAAINHIADAMNQELADKYPVFLCVLNGAMVFMGQLITKLNFPLQIDYIHVTRYQGEMSGEELKWVAEPTIALKDRTVVIVEDILDLGVTLAAIKQYCLQHGAREVYCAALIDKDRPREKGGVGSCEFTGLKVENKFLIGYGLDYKGFLRNLPGIYAVNE